MKPKVGFYLRELPHLIVISLDFLRSFLRFAKRWFLGSGRLCNSSLVNISGDRYLDIDRGEGRDLTSVFLLLLARLFFDALEQLVIIELLML